MKEKEKKDVKKDKKEELPVYEPPKIEVHNEDELLKGVAVLGCEPFPPS